MRQFPKEIVYLSRMIYQKRRRKHLQQGLSSLPLLGRDTRGVLRFHYYAIEDDVYYAPRVSFVVVQHHRLFLADPADQMSCESRFAARFHPPLTWPVALRHFTFVILAWEIRSEIINRSLLKLMIAAAVIIQSHFLGNGGAY